jgi:hypothetical protein
MSAVAAYESLVNDMTAMGIPRARAELAARKKLRLPLDETPDDVLRRADVLEKAEQHEITKLFRAFGFTVRNLSQSRASKIAPGVPDLFVTHDTLPLGFWWESKRQVGGRYSAAQVEFRADCERVGIACFGGDRFAARSHLISMGLATVVNGVLEPVRR